MLRCSGCPGWSIPPWRDLQGQGQSQIELWKEKSRIGKLCFIVWALEWDRGVMSFELFFDSDCPKLPDPKHEPSAWTRPKAGVMSINSWWNSQIPTLLPANSCWTQPCANKIGNPSPFLTDVFFAKLTTFGWAISASLSSRHCYVLQQCHPRLRMPWDIKKYLQLTRWP